MSDITKDYSFGGLVRSLRLKRGLTLRAGAKLLGMDPGNLSKLERSELDPPKSAKRISQICFILGAEISAELLVSTAFQHHFSIFKDRFFDDID